jgi:hypothetical protein
MTMQTNALVHRNPVWRERANYIIGAWCPRKGDTTCQTWEQLWSRQTAANRFEICCIPFFAYGLTLGDDVETDPEYMITRVVTPSGHSTFRAWFCESPEPTLQDELAVEVGRLGCLMEWYSARLLGIDASSRSQAQAVDDFLHGKEEIGQLVYEIGG